MRNDFAGTNPQFAASRSRPGRREHSDEALIAKIASGNRLAMQALFARHRRRVYHFVLRLIRDEAAAEDVTSEVFLAVWQNARRFEARSAASTWLLAIARYKALSARRRQPHAELNDELASTVADPADDPELVVQKKNQAELIRQSLAKLSPEHREVIDLVYYHGKSVKEVGEIVGLNEATVKTRMFYARRKLAELVAMA